MSRGLVASRAEDRVRTAELPRLPGDLGELRRARGEGGPVLELLERGAPMGCHSGGDLMTVDEAEELLAAARSKLARLERRCCDGRRLWPQRPQGWDLAAMRAARLAYGRALRVAAEAHERAEKAGGQQ